MNWKTVFIVTVSFFIFTQSVSAKKSKPFTFEDREIAKKEKIKNQKILVSKWNASLKEGSPKKRYYPETSSPVYKDGVIYIGTQGKVFYAIEVEKGKVLWRFKHDAGIAGKAALGEAAVYFSDLNGRVVALDYAGERLWMQSLQKDLQGQPFYQDGYLYLLSGENEVTCLQAASGEVVWQTRISTYIQPLTVRGQGQIVWQKGSLFAALADGRVYGLHPKTGKVQWQKNFSPPLKTFKDIDATLQFTDDAFFVGGYFGVVHKVKTHSRAIDWTVEVGTGVTPLVLQDQLVLADLRGGLNGYDLDQGKLLWSNELNGSVLSAPVDLGPYVFVASYEGEAFVLSKDAGDVLQTLGIGDGSLNEPLVVGSDVFVLTNTGQLKAFQLKDQF